jgi:cyclophilin family peptidyl-prolyl cis-trans isomerase/HEAT repeat protein
MCVRSSWSLLILYACSAIAAAGVSPTAAHAQDEAIVDVLAGVLAAEDARRHDRLLFQEAARHQEPIVRRHAALAMGRIGDPDAAPALIELLSDPDSAVLEEAAFALGLLADSSTFLHLHDLVADVGPDEQTDLHSELVTAIAKIGGPEAGAFFRELLVRWSSDIESGTPPYIAPTLLGEAWRLGPDAPLQMLSEFADAPRDQVRRGAVYSLSRLRAPDAAAVLLAATDDEDVTVRGWAARALTRAFADSAGLDRDAVATRLTLLVADTDAGVRVNALRTLATYRDERHASAAAAAVSDPEANVRIQALATLGDLGGADAAALLADKVDDGSLAVRQQALLSLARVDRGAALTASATWITDAADWQRRAMGAAALERIAGDTALGWLESLVYDDPDGRVVARAFEGLARHDEEAARYLAGRLLGHADPVVRTLAAQQVRERPTAADVDPLIEAYGMALEDPIPDARIASVEALGAVAALGWSERMAVEDRFLRRFPTCGDYLVRRAAEQHLSSAVTRWGPAQPVATGRDLNDYRDIARRLLLPAERGEAIPELVIATDRGTITFSLFGADAPITVNALLELADRHYFDGGSFHRVVPNFVIQGGDPRGDGWGGPGFALRDEINRNRYERGTVGMALSGPDTGGSQFFVTHTAQPHLDGTYTVIGQVSGGMSVVDRIMQGDRIRSVRRQ